MSEERRKDFVKIARKNAEECRVAIRKTRHEALDMLSELKKDGGASEDDVERGKKKAEEIVTEARPGRREPSSTQKRRTSLESTGAGE